MAKVSVYNMDGKEVESINLDDAVFGVEVNEHLVHMAVVQQLANNRQGTQKAKTRSEVRGGGRKPYRQKGTGNARQGSRRAVQWVGGGRYGTPVPRDYSIKQNRKESRLALLSALSEKAADKEIMVVDNFKLETPKTKDMIEILTNLKVEDKKVLIVAKELEENLILASRNLGNVILLEADEINVLDIVATNIMIVTEDALKEIEEVLK